MRHVRTFGTLVSLNLSVSLTYRGEVFLWQVGNMLIPLISLFVWQAAIVSGAQLPTSARYLTAYFVLVSVAEMLTASWTAFYLAEEIRDGGLNRYLCRPTSTHLNALANNVGEKVIKLVLLVPLVAVLAFALGDAFEMPTGLGRWLLAFASLIIAALMRWLLDVTVGSLAFWFADVNGFLRAKEVIVPVLSGVVVPLALLPDVLRDVSLVQPFRYLVSFPLEVLLGDVPGGLAAGFGLQVGWMLVFAVAAVLVWRLGLRTYSGTGA
ncbi:ABC transporter permease [Georgenia alba]|uniref:ABC transporter permease n=1 Tax=Georgenia alba TaxID=2233858 RepID=A0ABW2Q5N0_9MICO